MQKLLVGAIVLVLISLAYWAGLEMSYREMQTSASVEKPVKSGEWNERQKPTVDSSVQLSVVDTSASWFEQQRQAVLISSALNDVSILSEQTVYYLNHDDRFLQTDIALVFLRRLLDVDYRAAIQLLEGETRYRYRSHVMKGLFGGLARQDPALAIAALNELNEVSLKEDVMAWLAAQSIIAESGFQSTLKSDMSTRALEIFETVQKKNIPPSQRFYNATLLSGRERRSELNSALWDWWRVDPAAAENALGGISKEEDRFQLLQSVIHWSTQYSDEIRNTLSLVDKYAPGNRDLERNALSNMMRAAPTAALPLLEEYYERTGDVDVLASALSSWASVDRDAALEYAATSGDSIYISVAQQHVSHAMFEDPEAGMQWAMSQDDPSIQRQALRTIAGIDMSLAESWLEQLGNAEVSTYLLRDIAKEKAISGLESGLRWLDAHQEHPGFHEALRSVVMMASHRTNVDLKLVTAEYQHDPKMQLLFRDIGSRLASRDPDETSTWIHSLPNNENRQQARIGMLFTLASQEPERAIREFHSLEEASKVSVRFQLGRSLVQQNPEFLRRITAEFEFTEAEVNAIEGYGKMLQ